MIPLSQQAKKPPAAAVAAAAASSSKPTKPSVPAASGSLDTFKYKHSPEDSEALAAELIPTEIATNFGDSNWKLRLSALEEMAQWVEGVIDSADCEVIVRFLIKKGGNEKNFQVCLLSPVYCLSF